VFNPICQESQMHSSLTAVVLCIFAQAAVACVATGPHERDARMGAQTIKTSSRAAAAPETARPGGELIKTAAAGTREPPGAARPVALVVREAPESVKAEEPRSESAMLLAALALMCGIVLRRFGANRQ
jgi:hypothetical protein